MVSAEVLLRVVDAMTVMQTLVENVEILENVHKHATLVSSESA
jgi:hypothetical protein